ncbi:hypothetical protein [Flavobacterium sp. LAR06]|uniref:hypothetical protein n=1 Tax=Flavobacterium sp. LAR06 TaxID=3064897 RepID=UPI0035C165F0
MKSAIQLAFYQGKIKSPEILSKKLEREGIHMVLRKSKEGQPYGITYVDHKTQCVFNGRAMGKQYSAKGILERCEANNHTNQNHYYQKSILIASKNIQNLES